MRDKYNVRIATDAMSNAPRGSDGAAVSPHPCSDDDGSVAATDSRSSALGNRAKEARPDTYLTRRPGSKLVLDQQIQSRQMQCPSRDSSHVRTATSHVSGRGVSPYCTAFIMSKIGRYIATTMPPTTTPRKTIMSGSNAES